MSSWPLNTQMEGSREVGNKVQILCLISIVVSEAMEVDERMALLKENIYDRIRARIKIE